MDEIALSGLSLQANSQSQQRVSHLHPLLLLLLLLRRSVDSRIARRPQVRYISSGIVNCLSVSCLHIAVKQKCLQLCSKSLYGDVSYRSAAGRLFPVDSLEAENLLSP